MFLHLGNDIIVNQKEIIGIFDLDSSSNSKTTKDFLKKSQNDNIIESVCGELPKSFIVIKKKKKTKVYLSNISSVTLQKRIGYLDTL